jgi:hypothetical protein
VTESILSFVRLKSLVVKVEQFKGSLPVTTNWRSRVVALLPAVEVIVSVGDTLSGRVKVLSVEVLPCESIAKPPGMVRTSLSETSPVLVALKVAPDPLNEGVVNVHPLDTSTPAMSFSLMDSLKVSETLTLLAIFASLDRELVVIEGFVVFITRDKAGDANEV